MTGPMRAPTVSTLHAVVEGLDDIVAWSLKHESRLGYFAAVYKAATISTINALDRFDDAARMERFGVAFANRYFAALNAYWSGNHRSVPQPWLLAFAAHTDHRLSIAQHLLLPVNAHICWDLSLVAAQIGGDSLLALKHDFDLVNILVEQPTWTAVYDAAVECMPALGPVRRVVPCETLISQMTLRLFRGTAWQFAVVLARYPRREAQIKLAQLIWANSWAIYYRQPLLTPIVGQVVKRLENADVVSTIRALEG